MALGGREVGLRDGIAGEAQGRVERMDSQRRFSAISEMGQGVGKVLVEVVRHRITPAGLAH
jgi:hypothetical protein